MIGPREVLIFMVAGAAPILIAVGIGYFYFCRWARKEKESGRRFIDAHVSEVIRDRPTKKE